MAVNGMGSIFQLSASAISGTTGKLAEVTSVPIPTLENQAVDSTHHESSGNVAEYIADGVIEQPPITLELNLVPGSTTDTSAVTAVTSRALYYFKITVPAATGTYTYTGRCIVTSYTPGAVGIRGKMEATITIQPSGPITRAAVP